MLDLTFKEFELLKFLAQHPGRVFTRAHLLQEVWGYDYFGGTRTVDVHVRRLRAKLGPEHEALIGTVRNVGYRFVPVKGAAEDKDLLAAGAASRVGDGESVTTRPPPRSLKDLSPRPRPRSWQASLRQRARPMASLPCLRTPSCTFASGRRPDGS